MVRRGGPSRVRQCFCPRPHRPRARHPVHPEGASGGQRQYRQMARPEPADPAKPAAGALCARDGARARVPRGALGGLPRAASARRLRPRGKPVRRHQTGCVSRFGSQPVGLWTTLRVAHNPTGPTTTEAVNRCATKTGQLDASATQCRSTVSANHRLLADSKAYPLQRIGSLAAARDE